MAKESKINELARHMLTLSITVEKMQQSLESLLLTQKHLREVNCTIKRLDEHPEQSITHPDFDKGRF